jgi:hypothetical protein
MLAAVPGVTLWAPVLRNQIRRLRMKWFARLRKTPWYFKAFVALLLADCLMLPLSLLPGFYEHGFAHLGNPWWGPLIVFFFLFPDTDRGIKVIRSFAFAIALLYSINTVAHYLVNRGAHAAYPSNPGFFFDWLNWADGIVFPWLAAAACCFLPRSCFPLSPPNQTAK